MLLLPRSERRKDRLRAKEERKSAMQRPLDPVHVKGMHRGEEFALSKGREPGRGGDKAYRSARDSTGINAKARAPIDPAMPNIPPA